MKYLHAMLRVLDPDAAGVAVIGMAEVFEQPGQQPGHVGPAQEQREIRVEGHLGTLGNQARRCDRGGAEVCQRHQPVIAVLNVGDLVRQHRFELCIVQAGQDVARLDLVFCIMIVVCNRVDFRTLDSVLIVITQFQS